MWCDCCVTLSPEGWWPKERAHSRALQTLDDCRAVVKFGVVLTHACRRDISSQAEARAPDNLEFWKVVDTGAVTVQQDFPIARAFIILKGLGARHMTVVDKNNVPVGIVTRKNFLGMHVEQALHEFRAAHPAGVHMEPAAAAGDTVAQRHFV